MGSVGNLKGESMVVCQSSNCLRAVLSGASRTVTIQWESRIPELKDSPWAWVMQRSEAWKLGGCEELGYGWLASGRSSDGPSSEATRLRDSAVDDNATCLQPAPGIWWWSGDLASSDIKALCRDGVPLSTSRCPCSLSPGLAFGRSHDCSQRSWMAEQQRQDPGPSEFFIHTALPRPQQCKSCLRWKAMQKEQSELAHNCVEHGYSSKARPLRGFHLFGLT